MRPTPGTPRYQTDPFWGVGGGSNNDGRGGGGNGNNNGDDNEREKWDDDDGFVNKTSLLALFGIFAFKKR